MAGLIRAHAGQGISLPVRRASAIRPLAASQVTVRFASPLFNFAKVCRSCPLPAAALDVSKDSGSAVLANRQPSKDAIETLRNADAACFDVDSTVIQDEGIDELADFCGAGKAVAEWTAKAMTGAVPFEEALAARLSLIMPSLSQDEECLEKRPPRVRTHPISLVQSSLMGVLVIDFRCHHTPVHRRNGTTTELEVVESRYPILFCFVLPQISLPLQGLKSW